MTDRSALRSQPRDRDEASLLAAAQAGEAAACGELMRRHNRTAFRVAWSLTRDHLEAEEVVQEAYVKAFTRLDDFAGRSAFATWLTRIVVNEALMRRRQRERRLAAAEAGKVLLLQSAAGPGRPDSETPERSLARRELGQRLERALAALPADFRAVFMLRAVEEFSVEETAEALGLNPQTVKSRLFRARLQLRRHLEREMSGAFLELLPFAGARCEALAARVLARLAALPKAPP